MTFEYISEQDFYHVQLDEDESILCDNGEYGKKEILTAIYAELDAHDISQSLAVYHADGHQLWDIGSTDSSRLHLSQPRGAQLN